MIDHGDLFLEGMPAQTRGYLLRLLTRLRARYQRIVVPCAGAFSACQVAVRAGYSPGQLHASDVSLFSAVVGRAINEEGLGPLEIHATDDLGQLDLDDPATVLYALKVASLRERVKNDHDRMNVREIEAHPGTHIDRLRAQLNRLKQALAGMEYASRDLFEVIEEAKSDAATVLWINPPGYLKGYERLFETGGRVTWRAPTYRLFNPRTDFRVLRDLTANAPALCLRHQAEDPDEPRGAAVFGLVTSAAKDTKVILANRPDEVEQYTRRTICVPKGTRIAPAPIALLPLDHAFQASARVWFEPLRAEQAMYYRDLFAHRLGATLSEQHFGLVVDGYLSGVVGIHMRDYHTGRRTWQDKLLVEETYGFTVPSRRHPRLNRLLMMCITSRAFGDLLTPPGAIQKPDGLGTTCLSQYAEMKINRGILKLVNREPWQGGATNMYRLRYVAEFRDDTFKECFQGWLKTQGTKGFAPSARASKSGGCTSTNSKSRTSTRGRCRRRRSSD